MQDNQEELLPIVDEEGNVKGCAPRRICHNGTDRPLHPVVHLHVFDRLGRLYLQKRPEWKDIQPGRWDTAVGGHIDYGETVMDALRREAREELGLTDFSPVSLGRYVFDCPRERELINAFMTVVDETPHPGDELDGGRFWTGEEITAGLQSDPCPFTPNFASEYRALGLDSRLSAQ